VRYAAETDRRAFTLIELLVVIAIIAILAAILFPVFVHAKAQARTTECLSRLKDAGTAFSLYCDTWDGTMPSGGNAPQNNLIRWPLMDQLRAYLKTSQTHFGYTGAGPYAVKRDTGIPEVFFCPSFPEEWRKQSGWYIGAGTYQMPFYDYIGPDQFPAKKISYCIELWNRMVAQGKTETRVNPPRRGPSGVQIMYCSFGGHLSPQNPLPSEKFYYPHNGGSNCLYLDWHVKWQRDKSSLDQ
jgi:prepilin-type N-terminal cleavage/methylation domain-containing protein/prepilin-type processing-associated H-X9-DG protein